LELIKGALKYFDKDQIQNAYIQSHKQCRIPGIKRASVPTEDAYFVELIAVLKHWVPAKLRFNITTHPNSGINYQQHNTNLSTGQVTGTPQFSATTKQSESNKKTDILIQGGGRVVVVELVANEPVKSVEEHFDRACRDMKALGADEAWVLHFTVGMEVEGKFTYPFPRSDSPVNVIHICHDKTFSTLHLVYKNKDQEKVTEDIKL